MTQRGIANEIAVLCGIVHGYIASFCPPSDEAKALQVALDQMAPTFLDLTEELVLDDPADPLMCPACGEDLAETAPALRTEVTP